MLLGSLPGLMSMSQLSDTRHAPFDMSGYGVASIVNASTDRDIRFLGLTRSLQGGDSVVLAFDLNGKPQRVVIGSIDVIGALTSVVRPVADPLRLLNQQEGWEVIGSTASALNRVTINAAGPIDNVAVYLNDQRVLEGVSRADDDQPGVGYDLRPVQMPYLHVRSHPEQSLQIASIPRRGTIVSGLQRKERR